MAEPVRGDERVNAPIRHDQEANQAAGLTEAAIVARLRTAFDELVTEPIPVDLLQLIEELRKREPSNERRK